VFERGASEDGTAALELVGITKRYGATVGLDGASFRVRPGDVHALLGENGAGKSTVVKLLNGLLRPDAGEIRVGGTATAIHSPREAHRLGIQTAFQEISLLPNLSVSQNLLLPYEPVSAMGRLRSREAARRTQAILLRLGLDGIDAEAEVGDLDLPERQKLEIARAASYEPKILLLDEPTSALSGRDLEWLFALMRRLRKAGTTILFISHRMPEVRAICNSLSVLRNGRDVGTFRIEEVSDDAIIRLVIGRTLALAFPPKSALEAPPAKPAYPMLRLSRIAARERLRNVSLELWPGEILGVAALQGMGQLELFRAAFGLEPISSGSIEIDGHRVTLSSPRDAIKAHIGLSLVPEDRKTEALFLRLSGRANVSLPVIGRFAYLGWILRKAEDRAVRQALELVNVDPRAMYTPCRAFSGGNQQKIAIAKWLLARCRVLMMYDPTRGVDIGTKHEIFLLMRAFATAGGAILFYSTDLPELVNLCDSIIVLYRGSVVATLTGNEISEERIMRVALGGAAPLEVRP
jgi:ribose transport system ATP-binding protein